MLVKTFNTCLEHYARNEFYYVIQVSIFQIEKILRTLYEKNGIHALYTDENKIVPKGLEFFVSQLRENKLLSYKFSFFIEWLLTGSSQIIPENIRNKIAHGISDFDEFNSIYNRNNALSMILIYLILSKP